MSNSTLFTFTPELLHTVTTHFSALTRGFRATNVSVSNRFLRILKSSSSVRV